MVPLLTVLELACFGGKTQESSVHSGLASALFFHVQTVYRCRFNSPPAACVQSVAVSRGVVIGRA